MRQQAVNTFNEGLNFDLNPLTTPNNVLTDAINASFITFNGDELSLQNDAGNTKIMVPNSDPIEYITLSTGFYPLGIKEYGGVLYIISGKLPDVLAADVTTYVSGTSYTSGTKVYVATSKLFYEKKVTGTHSLPLEGSNTYWNLIGNETDYNNKYGYIEIGSYPSPEASDKKLFAGTTTLYDNSTVATTYRWYPTGVVSCVLGVDLKNTGSQNVEEKYQSSPDGGTTWVDVVGTPTRTSVYTNITACPVPFNWAGISVDATAYSIPNEVEIPYAENTTLTVQTPIKAGFNYIFLSIPQSKSVIIRDSMNNNITNLFTIVGTDNRTTHTINNIYKKNDAFATNLSTVLYITIY